MMAEAGTDRIHKRQRLRDSPLCSSKQLFTAERELGGRGFNSDSTHCSRHSGNKNDPTRSLPHVDYMLAGATKSKQ